MSLTDLQATKSLLRTEDKTTKAGEFSVNILLIHVHQSLSSACTSIVLYILHSYVICHTCKIYKDS